MSDLEIELLENENKQKEPSKADDIEEKRESLAILASLGTTKEFIGVEMSLGKIHKLSAKEVEKFYNRYQTVAGQKVTNGLVESAIKTVTKVVSYVAPIDNPDELCSDLQKDELVKRELSNFAGLLVLRGGRLVALASALIQVARHIKFDTNNPDTDEGVDEHTPPPHLRGPCE